MPVARPPRTEHHVKRDELLAQFKAAGLQATISTNGSRPDADIEVTIAKATKPDGYGNVTACVLTPIGQQRLNEAEP